MMITSRSYECYDKEKFLSDLSAVPFHVLLSLTMLMTRSGHFITCLSYFFVKKKYLSRRVEYVMNGRFSERCMYVTPFRLDLLLNTKWQ